MLADNPVLQKLKQDNEKSKIKKEGCVKATDKSYGFLEVDNKESYFIPPQFMKNLIHGDKIEAVITSNGDKQQAEPLKLIEPYLKRFVARIKYNKGFLNIIPDHPSIKNWIRAKSHLKNIDLQEGDWVIATLTEHAMNNQKFHMAEIIEFITTANDPQAPWWVVLRGLDLPKQSPFDEGNYEFKDKNYVRTDLTHLPFVTIDSEKTKDMDDALYIEQFSDGSWKLWIAIADPTGYIDENDKLDIEASKRAFSIYLPGRDIPMLPRSLSDDLCSLKEGEIRNVLVGCINIEADGNLVGETKFELATIKSQGKLVYDKVSDLLEGNETNFQPSEVIYNQIKMLESFCKARFQYRSCHASVFKDKPEYEFILNDDGSLKEIKIATRRIANRIVEEAMIAANTCAGKFLANHFHAGIFNIHMGFDQEKMSDVVQLLSEYNAPITDPKELSTVEGFSKIKRWVDEIDSDYIDNRLRKYQEYAQMSPVPGPHYGLGLDYYATWTSPIRKYGDMINHRLIKSFLNSGKHPRIPNDETIETMNIAKRYNRLAERNVKDWLYVKYLESYMNNGTVFTGEIFDITRGGLRIRLLENGATAFIPSSFICTDRKRIESDNNTGIMKIDGNEYFKISQTIEVVVAELNYNTRSIVAKLAKSIQ
jgi:exoribonuclease II